MGFYADHEHGMVDAEAASRHAAAAGLSVDAENVLYVRKAILDEHRELLKVLTSEARDASSTARPYGGDPVSVDASVAFPQRVDLLLAQCKEHVAVLLSIAGKLKDAALAYGYTEGEIAAANPVNIVAAAGEISATLHSMHYPWERG